MKKSFKYTLTNFAFIGFILSSCVPGTQDGGSTESKGGSVENTFDSVSTNYGRYLLDNPIVLSGNSNFSTSDSLAPLIGEQQRFITSNQFLFGSCSQNFGNVRDITNSFHDQLYWSYNFSQSTPFSSAIPSTLFSSSDRAYWFKDGFLKSYSNCGFENNAYYDPASNVVCLGHITTNPALFFATDPTVTYHEMGHAFNQISSNMRQRSIASTNPVQSSLGSLFYDEAGAINEGIADWYSFTMNKRAHIGEWALGRYITASRPMEEDDPLHAAGVDETTSGRLSYPAFVNYDPNNLSNKEEDVHYAGQIISHFMTEFYESVQDTSICGLDDANALRLTMHLIQETLSEKGDQTATAHGSPFLTTYRVNLDPENAYEWQSKVRLTNFREFMQTFGKYFLRTLGNPLLNMCKGTPYSQDNFEKLVDSYGLLLFRTYNDNENGITTGHLGSVTQVTPTNRIKSNLITKDFLIFDPGANAVKAFVIDSQEDIRPAIQNMLLSGQIANISSKIDGNLSYNNGNGRISPAEVVGISLNLYNNSNTTMAGIHVLANDWDHTKAKKPCNNLGDNWPSNSEGAADLTIGEGVQGGCDYVTRYNGKNNIAEPSEELAPVRLVEIAETDSTQWKSQSSLISRMGMSPNECLGGSDSKEDCFVRAIKGADHSYFSKIDPKQTWQQTVNNGLAEDNFSSSNVIFFEISPDIPHGTTFNCRMRARFSNCDDCYHDSSQNNDDYLDYEFSGAAPYQIINFSFVVLD